VKPINTRATAQGLPGTRIQVGRDVVQIVMRRYPHGLLVDSPLQRVPRIGRVHVQTAIRGHRVMISQINTAILNQGILGTPTYFARQTGGDGVHVP
jgi:hypothetical protein